VIIIRRGISLVLLIAGLCGFDPSDRENAFPEARRALLAAQAAPLDSPDRQRLWLDVATKYEALFTQDPKEDYAPEAAMNAAHAWKQLGNYTHVHALYKQFLSTYGSEQLLAELDAKPRAQNVSHFRQYEARLKYVLQVYEALVQLEIATFDYAGAAKTYASMSGNARFPKEKRVEAARNAIVLFGPLGQREAQMAERDKLVKLVVSDKDKDKDKDKDAAIDADYLVASFGYRDDAELEKAAAQKMARAFEAFVDKYLATTPKGHRHLVEASLRAARLERQAADEAAATKWLEKAVRAFDVLKMNTPTSAISSATQAQVVEADRLLLDATTKRDVANAQKTTVKGAEAIDARLAKVATKYSAPEWSIAVSTNRGLLWDSLRAQVPARDLPDVERLTVRHYAVADFVARQSSTDAKVASARLADLAALLGDAKMKAYVTSGSESPALTYADGMYTRRGLPNSQMPPSMASGPTSP
jgi:hypothetical protein